MLVLLAAAIPLPACAMTESVLIDSDPSRSCYSDSGSYFLSRTMFEVLVTSDVDANNNLDDQKHPADPALTPPAKRALRGLTKPVDKLISVTAKVVADRTRGYCLDFLASPTAKEAIYVGRTNDGLLTKISTDSEHRSAQIIKNIAQTILLAGSADDFDAAAERSSTAPVQTRLGQLLKVTYDPLNPAQANLINQSLRPLGFCLIMEQQTFEQHIHRVDDYCNKPLGKEAREVALDRGSSFRDTGPLVAQARGILYRPRVAYNYYLFVQQGGHWKLRKSVTVNMENQAPVLAVGIDRAFFTNRKTVVTFDNGALQNVRVHKGSELAGFVEVPLTIAQNVTSLPAQIVKVKIDITNERSTLIAAQDELIAAQRQYRRDVVAYQALQRPPGSNQPNQTPATDAPPFGDLTAMPKAGSVTTPATPLTTEPGRAATVADNQCQKPCVDRGSSIERCSGYCACYGRCMEATAPTQSTAVPQPYEERRRGCDNYCVGFLR